MTTSGAPSRPRGRPRSGQYSGKYEVVGDVELSPEEDAQARHQIEQADSERSDVSVTFRWGKKQLEIVRQAAQVAGIPYQTYLKDAVMRRAIEDLRGAREAGVQI
jgi:predicted DNA binding CopG/RHH family protein